MFKKNIIYAISLFTLFSLCAQEDKLTLRFYGYTALNTYLDTRQVVGTRDGLIALYPAPPVYDARGNDINAKASYSYSVSESRLGVEGTGPDIFCHVKPKGVFEADFAGTFEQATGSLRIRHAYLLLEGQRDKILLGQYWVPLCIPECFPQKILSFNGGLPFDPSSRMPYIAYTHLFADKKYGFLAALVSQQPGACSPGPDFDQPTEIDAVPVITSTSFIQWAIMPNMHLRLFCKPVPECMCGISGDVKQLVPRLVTEFNTSTHERVTSWIAQGFAAYSTDCWEFRSKLLYGQNGYDMGLISTYAVLTRDSDTDVRTYTPTATVSCWCDVMRWFHNHTIVLGLFGGYCTNLGARHELYQDPITDDPIIYTPYPNQKDVARVSPRIRYIKGPVDVGVEFEVTRASYGHINRYGGVYAAHGVTNFRLLSRLSYVF